MNRIFEQLFEDSLESGSIVGLTDELISIYIYNTFIHKKKSCLVVVSTLYQANILYSRLSCYTNQVLLFPMDDFLTSEALAVSPELKTTRLETLTQLLDGQYIIICNLMGYLRFLPSFDTWKNSSITLKVSNDYSIKDLTSKLIDLGYTREIIVDKTGTIALRGFVLDIFPVFESNPIRIEFFGDTIESIRTFHIDTQLTIEHLNEIKIHPYTEFLISNLEENRTYHQKELPLYTNSVSHIRDYLSDCFTFYVDMEGIKVSVEQLEEEIIEYNQSLEVPFPHDYMYHFENILPIQFISFYTFDRLDKSQVVTSYNSQEIEPIAGNMELLLKKINAFLKSNKTVILCVSNRFQVNRLLDSFPSLHPVFTNESNIILRKCNIIIKPIVSGFSYLDYIVYSEQELFSKQSEGSHYKTKFTLGSKIRDIQKLSVGDYVVHVSYGIGRYCGLKALTKNGLQKDYLQIEYKDGDKVYVPVEKIEFLNRYSTQDGVIPKLTKLGGVEWKKTKLRAQKKVESIASDLIELYSLREATAGYAFLPDNEVQQSFEKEFAYQPTADQLKVLEEIKKDMESPHPMDRLLCGDVGYGKTEVAFRVIMKAVLSSKQVAFLCPTTILSNQHYQNALNRFHDYPVRIALLNRFVSLKEQKQVLKDIQNGTIDVLIGTHRILSNDVIFADLGLLVIDEEQRFGVKHKEKIKQYKNNIDVLTLTATPIPRTLQMSMSGLRSLSLIETPPMDRYPIQTYVLAYNPPVIKDAIYKELSRNGQVFLLYNYIDDMEYKITEIQKLVPEARIISAHGRMDKSQLEKVMNDFILHKYDILLCTTIIETGIDIPSANTLIIMDADRFGLSQLYQIRGRVGRSNKIAYCYLIYQAGKILTDVATKRLKVIKEFTQLGSGFAIAMRDLSIRGAGDILGSEQAGFIDSVGIELFMQMLQDEVNRLKGIKTVESEQSTPFLDVTTSIDSSYVQDEELKIYIHKKINEIYSYEKLQEVKSELEDRFGKILPEMEIYMYEEWFEYMARNIGVDQVRQTKNFIEIYFSVKLTQKINGETLFIEVMKLSRMFRFKMQGKRLIIILDIIRLEKHFVYYLVDLLEVIKKAIP